MTTTTHRTSQDDYGVSFEYTVEREPAGLLSGERARLVAQVGDDTVEVDVSHPGSIHFGTYAAWPLNLAEIHAALVLEAVKVAATLAGPRPL